MGVTPFMPLNLYPSYLGLRESGELEKRVEKGIQSLEKCRLCPWDCEINRLKNEKGLCKIGRFVRVASYSPHLGEESCLRGWRGSGTIFFSGCNLRCVFCQNYDISQNVKGVETKPLQLAKIMLELQDLGCHNINLVTPEHVVPQILEALLYAVDMGLRLPIVYNTSGFDSLESLSLMEGIVDIYMPDFKYWDEEKSKRYLKSPKYPDTARKAIKEMYRQAGDLVMDDKGLARRGVLVRHLVMPGALEDSREIMQFLSQEISPFTYVNIMNQYHPTHKVDSENYPEIDRRITAQELNQTYQYAKEAGLSRFDK